MCFVLKRAVQCECTCTGVCCQQWWIASSVAGSVHGVNECSTVGTRGDSCECTSHHVACDCCGIPTSVLAGNMQEMYMHMCLLQTMMGGLKCTRECALCWLVFNCRHSGCQIYVCFTSWCIWLLWYTCYSYYVVICKKCLCTCVC